MDIPKVKENTIETPKTRVIALEGIGGAGKSHISQSMVDFINNSGGKATIHKIAGLGNSSRVESLKQIMASRYERFKKGIATEQELNDRKRDRIFRLAATYQTRQFIKYRALTQDTHTILDRTPLMAWVFSVASDPDNPYLQEIWQDSLELFRLLDIEKVLFLQSDVIKAYSRIIARYCIGNPNIEQMIVTACREIGAGVEQQLIIFEEVMTLIGNFPDLQRKPFERWDLIPLNVAIRENELHLQALEAAKELTGSDLVIIDANDGHQNVLENVINAIT